MAISKTGEPQRCKRCQYLQTTRDEAKPLVVTIFIYVFLSPFTLYD